MLEEVLGHMVGDDTYVVHGNIIDSSFDNINHYRVCGLEIGQRTRVHHDHRTVLGSCYAD